MKNGQIWVYKHPSGEDRDYQIVQMNEDGRVLVNGPAGGETWTEQWIERETEKGSLFMKPRESLPE